MPLSPREVESKQFVTALRGYDVDEVRAFLSEVAEEMRLLVQALYAALPDDKTADLPGQPDLDDLVRLGSSVSEEVVRLAEVGRAARIDAEAMLRLAANESRELQSSAAGARLRAVQDAGRLIQRARTDAEEIIEAAHRRERELRGRLRSLEAHLAQAEQAVGNARADVLRAAGELPASETSAGAEPPTHEETG